MFRYVLLGLLLLGAAHCDIQLKQVENSEAPGVSKKEYVLVDKDSAGNDQVVGHVVQIQTGGHTLGRRFGFGTGPVAFMGGMGDFNNIMEQLDLPGQIFHHMQQARCAMMRQKQDDFSLLNQRLGFRLAPMFLGTHAGPGADDKVEELSADAELQNLSEGEQEATLFGNEVLPTVVAADASGLPPFQLQPTTWHERGWEGREWHHHPHMMAEEGEAQHHDNDHENDEHHHHHHHHVHENGKHHHHHWWHMWGHKHHGERPGSAEWASLEDTTMPAIGDDVIDWSFYDENGNLNVGLLVFMILCAACLSVWLAGIHCWIAFRRVMSRAGLSYPDQRQFLSNQSDLKKPLMSEGPMDSPKLYTGVECAADHAPKDGKFAGLHYEPLADNKA